MPYNNTHAMHTHFNTTQHKAITMVLYRNRIVNYLIIADDVCRSSTLHQLSIQQDIQPYTLKSTKIGSSHTNRTICSLEARPFTRLEIDKNKSVI